MHSREEKHNVLSTLMEVHRRKSRACLISLDFFKAYDRVFLPFLLKVLETMNFGNVFISWISMLHFQATTRLILKNLTSEILLLLSIRQGDPLAMILFIIYIEPLLIALEEELSGFKMGPLVQKTESFCDDVNVVTNNLQDFQITNEVVLKFELSSGAILSRNCKCKVLGFGSWADRDTWPLSWLTTAKTVKMFGIIISNSYKDIIKLNWDLRFRKFSEAIYSWNNRQLDTLAQRIEVLRVFALS